MIFPLCYTTVWSIVSDVVQPPVTCCLGRIVCCDLGQEHDRNLVNFTKSLKPSHLTKDMRNGRSEELKYRNR